MDKEERLARRHWLLTNMNHILKEATYAKAHKENFFLPKFVLWNYNDEKGVTAIP